MKIVFFEARDRERELLSEILSDHELAFHTEKLSLENFKTAETADIVSVFVGSEFRRELIDLLPKLKLIVTRSTGFDHIDAKYAASKNIKVASVPAYGSRTVAEFTFGLILALSRNIYLSVMQMKQSLNYDFSNYCGFDLYGKTVGVVGTGRIGKSVIKIAKGFGMKILATDIYPDNNFAEEEGFGYVPLAMLLSASDVVTLHTPYNETTHHLINSENIKLMKKSALLINTARGEIIDTVALLNALKMGAIKGAGLDVVEGEKGMKAGDRESDIAKYNLEIVKMPNVLATPHIAFFTEEAEGEIIKTTIKNIQSFIKGTPENLVA